MSFKQSNNWRKVLLASAAAAVLTACGGGSVQTPGETSVVITPPVSPPPPPAQSVDIDLVPGDCSAGTTLTTVENTAGSVEACLLTGTITENITLDSSIGYIIQGAVFVGQDTGEPNGDAAVLTIPAGTTLFGAGGEDFLVISRGSRIEAVGTADNPIIMTSIQDIQETVDPVNDRGLWGGLIINGFAPQNNCISATAAGGSAECEASGEGGSGLFGGDNANDNSGTLQFLQVRFAGNQINNDDELNGIAFQGVGNGTTCDHVQVHNNADDGIEFFGGTVNCSFIVLTGNADDSLDYTDGWVGSAQFVLVQHGENAGDRAFEFDNQGGNSGDRDALPRSNPTVANFTLLGAPNSANPDSDGLLVRAGTAGRFCNGVIVGFNDDGFDVDEDSTIAQVQAGNLTIESLLFDNDNNVSSGDNGESFDTQAFVDNSPNVEETANSLVDGFFPGGAELAIPSCDLTAEASNPALDIDNVSYIGAFGPDEGLAGSWAAGWTFNLLPEVSTTCPAGTTATGETINGTDVCSIDAPVLTDVTLTDEYIYQLDQPVFVGQDMGADPANPLPNGVAVSLTINQGVTIFGEDPESFIVVSRGSQIFSNGTAANPVVMTAADDVRNENGFSPVTSRGLWGGLILNGRAPQNDCISAVAAGGTIDCEAAGEGGSGLYGGASADDNSGRLLFTRVSYAGNQINNDDELNGIAFQGVGNGTEVDFIQVHNNADDGIEFFGGTVNASHIVLTGNSDDSFDYTDGWTGNIQYLIIDIANDAGDRAMEMDNQGGNSGDRDALPRSNPTVSNFTLIGADAPNNDDVSNEAMLLRAGTAGTFVNGIITGFLQDDAIDIDEAATVTQANAGNIVIDSVFLTNNPNGALDSADDDASGAALQGVFDAGVNNLDGDTAVPVIPSTLTTGTNPPAFDPGANELAVIATDPTALDPFFDTVDYVGAVENSDDDWFVGWTLLVDQ